MNLIVARALAAMALMAMTSSASAQDTPAAATPAPAPPSKFSVDAPTGAEGGPGSQAVSLKPALPKDELSSAGYVPGYRLNHSLGMSPYAPRVGALPGGMTPAYGAPNPTSAWTFRWSGFLTASLQTSINQRGAPAGGQSKTVLHVPPQTIDEYASFVGTNTMPSQYAQMSFAYGNDRVTANVSLTTWNPSSPTTYYQIGSEQFINNAYLSFTIPPIADISLRATVGYFYNVYGSLGQYGLGMYTNPLVSSLRGVGENIVADYSLSDSLSLAFEEGVMGSRNGMGPINVIPTGQNGSGNPIWPSAWMYHFHLALLKKGDRPMAVRLHYLANFAADDRTQRAVDNPVTRQIDESHVRDGRIDILGIDGNIGSPVWGYVGGAVSYLHARDAYPVKGLISFGGDGENLTNRWFGQQTSGNGKLVAAGLNYSASIGRILAGGALSPGPDLAVNAGFVIAATWSDFAPFDGRVRHKYGVDLQYTALSFLGAGVRVDRVVPNSKDSQETFHVIAPRVIFKGGWDSSFQITLLYAKWFYGSHSHSEGSLVMPGERLDDQLFALNGQMYW